MALSHAYIRATKPSPGKDDDDDDDEKTLLQRINERRRSTEGQFVTTQYDDLGDSAGEEAERGPRPRFVHTDDEDDAPAAPAGAREASSSDDGALPPLEEIVARAGDDDDDDAMPRMPLVDAAALEGSASDDEEHGGVHERHAAVMDEIASRASSASSLMRSPESSASGGARSPDTRSVQFDDAATTFSEVGSVAGEPPAEEILYDGAGKPYVWRYDADGIRHKRHPGDEEMWHFSPDGDEGEEEDSSDEDMEFEEPEPVVEEDGRELIEMVVVDDREVLTRATQGCFNVTSTRVFSECVRKSTHLSRT